MNKVWPTICGIIIGVFFVYSSFQQVPEKSIPGEKTQPQKVDAIKNIEKTAVPEPGGYLFLRGEKEVGLELGAAPFEPLTFTGIRDYAGGGRKLGCDGKLRPCHWHCQKRYLRIPV